MHSSESRRSDVACCFSVSVAEKQKKMQQAEEAINKRESK
jgi:hypothetical protein